MKSVLRGMKDVASYVNDTEEKEGDAVTVRPSATAILAIDSDDRYQNYLQRRLNPSYPFSFTIQKNEALLNGFFKRLALTEFRLNWTLPNISSAWGNTTMTVHYKIGAGADIGVEITLGDGFYGAEEIAKYIKQELQLIIHPDFDCTISNADDDAIVITAAPGYTFFISSMGTVYRELVDMLNLPTQVYNGANTYSTIVRSGVPNLRPMDYFDIVSSQLSYNQELKDATSAPITRDMIARIYLDDSVPSSSLVTTNYYSNTQLSTAISAAAQVGLGDVTLTVTSTTGFAIGAKATVAGTTGGAGWNAEVEIIHINSATSIDVLYDSPPTGVITSFVGATLKQFTFNQFSTPQTTWDDRVNGVTPFVIYRQFATPKYIRWNHKMPIGNLQFELYDDQGRNIQDLWNSAYPANTNAGRIYANSFVWNSTLLVSED